MLMMLALVGQFPKRDAVDAGAGRPAHAKRGQCC